MARWLGNNFEIGFEFDITERPTCATAKDADPIPLISKIYLGRRRYKSLLIMVLR